MEYAPKPVFEPNFKKRTKHFSLNSKGNINYDIYLQIESPSEIRITAIQSNLKKKFEHIYSLESLKSIKYLSLLETIDEIYDEIINKIELKIPLIIEETNNLKINIETFHTKFKEINFYLEEKEKNTNDKFNEIYLYINELRENEKKQNEKIQLLVNKTNELENKIKILENNYKDLNNENKSLKNQLNEQIKKNEIIFCESIILKDKYSYIELIKNWINPNKPISFKLLYRMSDNGNDIRTFHKLCDYKGPTISLIYLNDGNIIGGYTSVDWDTTSSWKKDNNSFIFNLNKKLKCNKKIDGTSSIYCDQRYACYFNSFGYNENSSYNMKKFFFFNRDGNFLNGNQILDYNKSIELEPKEVEVLNVFLNE